MDVWPLVAEITDSDFLQGEAMAIQHAHFGWLPPAGPEVRSGVSSFTATNTHHEGGFSSAGVFALGVGSYLRVDGEGPQEPDARWEWNWEGCTWTDHAALYLMTLHQVVTRKVVILSRFVALSVSLIQKVSLFQQSLRTSSFKST